MGVEMSDAFWMAFFGFLGILIVQYVIYQNNKQARALTDKKIDDNTALTRAGTTAAVVNAKAAATTAEVTKQAVDVVNKKLNGGVDSAIIAAVAPIKTILESHIEQDKKDLEAVKDSFTKLEHYIHLRNHDVLDALNRQAVKLELIHAQGTKEAKK